MSTQDAQTHSLTYKWQWFPLSDILMLVSDIRWCPTFGNLLYRVHLLPVVVLRGTWLVQHSKVSLDLNRETAAIGGPAGLTEGPD